MIRINKSERDALIANGVKCGENGISKTHSHHTSWYLAETRRNLSALKKIRN